MAKNYIISDNGIKCHWNFKLLPSKFEAITLFGHVFFRGDKHHVETLLNTEWGRIVMNHERIHLLQASSFKTKYLAFYILYVWYWIIGLFKYGVKNNISYHKIPFEQEAYNCECDMFYNKTKWKDYLKK